MFIKRKKILSRSQFFPTQFIDSMQYKPKSQQVIFVNIDNVILKFVWRGKSWRTD